MLRLLPAQSGGVMRYALMLVLVLLSGRTEAASDALRNKYLAAWAARLDGYRSEYVRHDAALRKEIAAGNERIFASGSVEWSELVGPVMEYSLKIRDNFTIAGRGETIKRFIAHIQTDPTPGLTEVWFQTQVAELQRQAQAVDSNTQFFLTSLKDRVEMSETWILEMEQLARAQGMVVGTVQELPLLFQNAQSYYREVRQTRAEEQRQAEQQRQRMLDSLAVLGRLNYQQQLFNTLNRPRTCQRVGRTVTCF
jgi:hypothetical protein